MIDRCLTAGWPAIVCYVLLGLHAAFGTSFVGEPFPLDRELLLDVRPMRPLKRVPVLNVAPNGEATIDLWCKSVKGRVELSNNAIRIETSPLPEDLPRYMSAGQCTPERMQADQEVLADMAQVTTWRRQGQTIMLVAPKTLRFRPSDY